METIDKLDYAILNDLKARAVLNGGECLSSEYINCKTPMLWRCDKGHTWETTSTSIKQGSWCPMCNKRKRKGTIEEMQKIAEEREGKCLSIIYVNNLTKLKWQCKEGHIWDTRPLHVKSGRWCAVCAINYTRDTIQEMQQLAAAHNGKCLSTEYINSTTKLEWQCENGHVWKTLPKNVKHGSWCPECIKGTIEEFQQIAAERKGKCLSTEYINSRAKLKWQCKEGHIWEATPSHIKSGGWCCVCFVNSQKNTIQEMQWLAAGQYGKCLSTEYINSTTKLKWQCKEGHVWDTKPYCVKRGNWCPTCGRKKRRRKYTVENIKEFRSLLVDIKNLYPLLLQSKGSYFTQVHL